MKFIPELGLFVCITSDARPDKSHAWSRAAVHALDDFGFPFAVRLAAHASCMYVAEVIARVPRPPKRAIVQFGWKGIPGKI
jgi:hypothetical protein